MNSINQTTCNAAPGQLRGMQVPSLRKRRYGVPLIFWTFCITLLAVLLLFLKLGHKPTTRTHRGSNTDIHPVHNARTQPRAYQKPSPLPPLPQLNQLVWWFAPFYGKSGFGTEATTFVLSLHSANISAPGRFVISHDGDLSDDRVIAGLPKSTLEILHLLERHAVRQKRDGRRANTRKGRLWARKRDAKLTEHHLKHRHGTRHSPPLSPPFEDQAIAICHTFAGHWHTPYSTCTHVQHSFLIGRTMFETDRVPPAFLKAALSMDEVWLPSTFSRDSYLASGVPAEKLRIVEEPVNTTFFDPSKHEPIPLPFGNLVVGERAGRRCKGSRFAFLSVFKFEKRKGWDVLLRAYLQEFTAEDCVELYIITRPFQQSELQMGVSTLKDNVNTLLEDMKLPGNWPFKRRNPAVYLMTDYIPGRDLPRYYRSADAFVLPSRGEGWGLPIVESMSMGLPVIATNWSGMTEYMSEDVGYPLRVEGLVDTGEGGWFEGQKWAQPSEQDLRRLMRWVVQHQEEARAKGEAGRQLMVSRYSPEVMAYKVHRELLRVEALLQSRRHQGRLQ